jgi:hypothetical protein
MPVLIDALGLMLFLAVAWTGVTLVVSAIVGAL